MGCVLSTSSGDELTSLSPLPITPTHPPIPDDLDVGPDAWFEKPNEKPTFCKNWTGDELRELVKDYKDYIRKGGGYKEPELWIFYRGEGSEAAQLKAAFELHCLLNKPHFMLWTQTMKEDLAQYFCRQNYVEKVIEEMKMAYPLRGKLFSKEEVHKMIQWLKMNGYVERQGWQWIVPKRV